MGPASKKSQGYQTCFPVLSATENFKVCLVVRKGPPTSSSIKGNIVIDFNGTGSHDVTHNQPPSMILPSHLFAYQTRVSQMPSIASSSWYKQVAFVLTCPSPTIKDIRIKKMRPILASSKVNSETPAGALVMCIDDAQNRLQPAFLQPDNADITNNLFGPVN